MKRYLHIPLVLLVLHVAAVFACWGYLASTTPVEPGACWEFIFGVIDFLACYLVGVPRSIAEAGVSSGTSSAYPLYFLVVGSVQWSVFGILVSLVRAMCEVKGHLSINHPNKITGANHGGVNSDARQDGF